MLQLSLHQPYFFVEVDLTVLLAVLLGVEVVFPVVVVFRVDDLIVLFEVDFGGVGVGVLQVVGGGQYQPIHFEVVVLAVVLVFGVDDGGGVDVGVGVDVDVKSGGAQGSLDSRFLAT